MNKLPFTVAALVENDMRSIPIDVLHPDATQPRRDLDGTSTESEFRTLEGLARSIRERGILQPLRVTQLPSGDFQIQSGHRRHAAALLAGLKTVPCIVVQDDGSAVNKLVDQITENTQRKAMTTNEMAMAVQELLRKGLNQAEVSRKLGVNEGTVSMLVKLETLPGNVSSAFKKGLIESPRAAYDLVRLPTALQNKILSEIGSTALTQAAVREAKKAWEANAWGARHPFQTPAMAKATYKSLMVCLKDDPAEHYSQQQLERDRNEFFGVDWQDWVRRDVVVEPAPAEVNSERSDEKCIKLPSLSRPQAWQLIFALRLITGTPASESVLSLAEPSDKELADEIASEIEKLSELPTKGVVGQADIFGVTTAVSPNTSEGHQLPQVLKPPTAA
jgi:ParB family chromosome partitioning protein